jgi:hypothetical protein
LYGLFYLAIATALLTVVLALWKGGPAERLGVLSYLCISGAHYLFKPADPFSLAYSYGFLAADLLIAAAFLVLALRYSSLWLAGAMIAQGLATAAHGFHLEDEQINQHLTWFRVSVWDIANNTFTSMVVWMLLGGTIVSWRNRIRKSRAARTAALAAVPAAA